METESDDGVFSASRVMTDRRIVSWRTDLYDFLCSRRRNTRRDVEDQPMFTGWHHLWLFFSSHRNRVDERPGRGFYVVAALEGCG